eukprot:8594102-Ditylum_brightwellii.AAC.1
MSIAHIPDMNKDRPDCFYQFGGPGCGVQCEAVQYVIVILCLGPAPLKCYPFLHKVIRAQMPLTFYLIPVC